MTSFGNFKVDIGDMAQLVGRHPIPPAWEAELKEPKSSCTQQDSSHLFARKDVLTHAGMRTNPKAVLRDTSQSHRGLCCRLPQDVTFQNQA